MTMVSMAFFFKNQAIFLLSLLSFYRNYNNVVWMPFLKKIKKWKKKLSLLPSYFPNMKNLYFFWLFPRRMRRPIR